MTTSPQSKFALSEGGEYTIRATVWVAMFLALAGVAIDSAGSLRQESVFSGTETATAEAVAKNAPSNGAALATTALELEGWPVPPPKPLQQNPEPLSVLHAGPSHQEAVIARACAHIEPGSDRCQDRRPQRALPVVSAAGQEPSRTSSDYMR